MRARNFRLRGMCLGLLILVAAYSFFIEPQWLEVTRHEIRANLSRPLKIAHLTDLHTRAIGTLEKKVQEALRREKPDIIFVTGDMLSDSGETEPVRAFLSSMQAPLGVWGVEGNWDHWILDEREDRSLAAVPGLNLLRNRGHKVRHDVWVVGLDDALSGIPDPKAAFIENSSGSFCIALFHSPAYFSEVAGRCPLNLSGHTHGGQIRLPFLGALWLPPKSGPFISGWYEANHSKMYVNRGIGTSIVGARLFCRPELAIITVRNA